MPEQKAALMARGIAISINTSIFAALMVLPGVFLTGIASGLVRGHKPWRFKD